MYRTQKLIIRLHKHERAVIDRMAQIERLPSSTLARQLLLKEAERRGLLPVTQSYKEAACDDQPAKQ